MNINIQPLHYNSKCIGLVEWVALFTLCLAPLIAHIASGTPSVLHLSHSRPKWYDQLCHYNPTSILWRYAAIADRRSRALDWNYSDLAATNAIFWTARGWDGDEQMTLLAAPFLSRTSQHTKVQIVSITMLKTIITTLQGISALYSLIGGLAGLNGLPFSRPMGLDVIYLPLAVLGLLRLFAAAWLTENFDYTPQNHQGREIFPQRATNQGVYIHEFSISASQDDIDPFLIAPLEHGGRFKHPKSSWPSRIIRTSYCTFVAGALAMSLFYMMPPIHTDSDFYSTSMTLFVASLFYVALLTLTLVLYAYYFFRGQTTSTLLPCISQTWYKIYTVVMFSFMLVLFIIASVETNRVIIGVYTSQRLPFADQCNHNSRLMYIAPDSDLYAIAFKDRVGGRTWEELARNNSKFNLPLREEMAWQYNWTGWMIQRQS